MEAGSRRVFGSRGEEERIQPHTSKPDRSIKCSCGTQSLVEFESLGRGSHAGLSVGLEVGLYLSIDIYHLPTIQPGFRNHFFMSAHHNSDLSDI